MFALQLADQHQFRRTTVVVVALKRHLFATLLKYSGRNLVTQREARHTFRDMQGSTKWVLKNKQFLFALVKPT